eukprot:509086_1
MAAAIDRLVFAEALLNVTFPIVLGTDVSGYIDVRGGISKGRATIRYVIDKCPLDNRNTKVVINSEPVEVLKTVQAGIDMLEPTIKASAINLFPTNVEYDVRALMYVVGKRLAQLAARRKRVEG